MNEFKFISKLFHNFIIKHRNKIIPESCYIKDSIQPIFRFFTNLNRYRRKKGIAETNMSIRKEKNE